MVISLILAVIIIVIDQITKFTIYGLPAKSIIGNLLWFESAFNTGVAFSMFKDKVAFFSIVSIIASLVFLFFIINKSIFKNKSEKICLGIILGGAVGNLIDRIYFKGVRDFIYLKFMDFAIFNIADMAVSFGAIAFCLVYFINGVKPKKKTIVKNTQGNAFYVVKSSKGGNKSSNSGNGGNGGNALESGGKQDEKDISDIKNDNIINDVGSKKDRKQLNSNLNKKRDKHVQSIIFNGNRFNNQNQKQSAQSNVLNGNKYQNINQNRQNNAINGNRYQNVNYNGQNNVTNVNTRYQNINGNTQTNMLNGNKNQNFNKKRQNNINNDDDAKERGT